MQFQLDSDSIEVAPLGDAAIQINLTIQSGFVSAVCDALAKQSFACVRDIVPAYETIVIHYETDSKNKACNRVELINSIRALLNQEVHEQDSVANEVQIPVLYDGEDLKEIAAHTGLSSEQVVQRHSQATYRVRLIGFMPGFPYLEGLDQSLAMPRREVPRTKVPAGSVGIGGNQTGIYPFDSPGGWNLLGRTPVPLFDTRKNPPSLLTTGDRVKFRPIEAAEWEALQQHELDEGADAKSVKPTDKPLFEVIHPGLQTTIQDLGRWGWQAMGVTPGGAMDADSASLANWLVGNQASSPVVEMALVGPRLTAMQDLTIAVVGAKTNWPSGRRVKISQGEVVDLQQITVGARAYLAVRGGFVADEILGAKGTDLKSRFGGHRGRALIKGDQLFGKTASYDQDLLLPNWYISTDQIVPQEPEGKIRFLPGPQADLFDDSVRQAFSSHSFTVSSRSDRMGIRLQGQLPVAMPMEMLSEPTVLGAIQVPPSGEPIILMADRQTVGGYPVIGVVASVDIPKLAQRRPGEALQFVEITIEDAERLQAERQQNLRQLQVGIEQTLQETQLANHPRVKQEVDSNLVTIDLNGDAGEGIGNDEQFIPSLTSVNIACGAHAGDEPTMRRAVQIANQSNVAIGAHPGFDDPINFGRVAMALTPAEVFQLVLDQIKHLQAIAYEYDAKLQHVKPHGALYHQATNQPEVANALAEAVVASDGPRWLLGPANSELESAAKKANLLFAAEAFADRAYDMAGRLIPRTDPRALLTDAEKVVQQACSLASRGEVLALPIQSTDDLTRGLPTDQQGRIALKFDFQPKTLCLHGDTPQAVSLAAAVRESLEKANIRVQRFGSC